MSQKSIDMKSLLRLMKECLKSSKDNTDKGLAGHCLMNGRSFQLTSDAANDRLIGLREWVRATRRWKVESSGFKKLSDSKILVSLGGMPSSKAVVEYIQYSNGGDVGCVFSRDEINAWEKISRADKFAFHLFALSIALRCLFSERRVNVALLLRAAQVNYFLLKKIERFDIQKVYNFVPFEIDSNFQSLLLRQAGVKVAFIPSSGPLGTWNRIMICDEVVFSTPYHDEEKAVFSDTMRFDRILRWGPEKAYSYIQRYLENRPVTNPKTIGFYSHGSWLRLKLGHVQTEMNLAGAEDQCVVLIKDFLHAHSDYSLVIFAHPREKSKQNWKDTQAHYEKLFSGFSWKFSDLNTPSSHAFEQADIGISTFSTIVYERLHAGYKTIICNYGIHNFPMKNSTLNAITFENVEGLETQITEITTLSEDQFFLKKNLIGYRNDKLNQKN